MELDDRPEPPVVADKPMPGQTSLLNLICTSDENCGADVDQHQPDCPVEQQLRDTFGF